MTDPWSAPPGPGAGDDLVTELGRWLADTRVDEAARARSNERWLRQQAAEEATFAGVLLDLAERDAAVVVNGAAGRTHRGRVAAVAADFCALRTTGGTDVLLAYRAMAVVRPQRGGPEVVGDRVLRTDRSLVEFLVGLAGERPQVLVVSTAGDQVSGDLREVGRDVLRIRAHTDPPSTAYVNTATLAEVSLI